MVVLLETIEFKKDFPDSRQLQIYINKYTGTAVNASVGREVS